MSNNCFDFLLRKLYILSLFPTDFEILIFFQAIARMKIDLAETVPSEPSADNVDSISVVFKLPNGARVERRFLRTNLLKVGFCLNNFKNILNF